MELKQRMELRKLLAPELRQSLNILALHLLDLNQVVEQELLNNPLLEELSSRELPIGDTADIPPSALERIQSLISQTSAPGAPKIKKDELMLDISAKKMSLQDVLLRQLGMFTSNDEDFAIGQEIIGNIDENGYLRVSLDELEYALKVPVEKIEKVVKLIQKFEPAGVAASSPAECLLIQLRLKGELEPLIKQIIEKHLEDIAKKNYTLIAKALKQPLEIIEPLIHKILKLDPKPGRNFSAEEAERIVPDVTIEEKDEDLEVSINNEYVPTLKINKVYKDMLKSGNCDDKTKEYLTAKLRNAVELIRAMVKRKSTLNRVVDAIVEVQRDAILHDLSSVRPLTFAEIASKLNLHESTVCRVVMNKYVKTPQGTIALKNFFSGEIKKSNGESVSSTNVKKLIKEMVDHEDKKRPLSDQAIVKNLLQNHNINLARRTVAKYREELKILSSTYRKIR